MKKVGFALLAVILAFCTLALCACNDDADRGNGYVQTQGVKIVDGNGKAIGLYGTNLGGWLVQESWLVPTDIGKEYGQIDMMLSLANRFGLDGMNRLLDVYMDNWVTEADFESIAKLGFNCVRIPFTYLNLTDAVMLDASATCALLLRICKFGKAASHASIGRFRCAKSTVFTPYLTCTAR